MESCNSFNLFLVACLVTDVLCGIGAEDGFCRKVGDNLVQCDDDDFRLSRLESKQVAMSNIFRIIWNFLPHFQVDLLLILRLSTYQKVEKKPLYQILVYII